MNEFRKVLANLFSIRDKLNEKGDQELALEMEQQLNKLGELITETENKIDTMVEEIVNLENELRDGCK